MISRLCFFFNVKLFVLCHWTLSVGDTGSEIMKRAKMAKANLKDKKKP